MGNVKRETLKSVGCEVTAKAPSPRVRRWSGWRLGRSSRVDTRMIAQEGTRVTNGRGQVLGQWDRDRDARAYPPPDGSGIQSLQQQCLCETPSPQRSYSPAAQLHSVEAANQ